MLPTLVPLPRHQNTIARPASVDGFGFWSGRDVRLQFRPAPPDTGIVFVRGDLRPAVRIPARVACRQETPRRTTLCHRDARVEMVEHVMAALAGLRIDNCEVWVDAVEMPGCDGSSLPFVQVLQAAGIVPQPAVRARMIVTAPTRVGDEARLDRGPSVGRSRDDRTVPTGFRLGKPDRASNLTTGRDAGSFRDAAGRGSDIHPETGSRLAASTGSRSTSDASGSPRV